LTSLKHLSSSLDENLGEEDERTLSDLLVEQVEFAEQKFQNGQIDLANILNTQLFSFDKAQQSAGWLKEMRGEHIPESEEYGTYYAYLIYSSKFSCTI
jgi:G3E family GTPase